MTHARPLNSAESKKYCYSRIQGFESMIPPPVDLHSFEPQDLEDNILFMMGYHAQGMHKEAKMVFKIILGQD